MTTSSSSDNTIPPPELSGRNGDIPAPVSLPKRIFSALWAERQWLWILIPYLLAWFVPVLLCSPQWRDLNQPLAFEPWILVGAGLLVWSNRAWYAQQWQRIQVKFPPSHPLRRSNPVVLIIGCILLLLSHMIQVKGISVGSLIVITVGIVLAVYGSAMTKVLAVPLGFLCLMIPPPDSIVEGIASRFLRGSLLVTSSLLNLANFPNSVSGLFIKIGDNTVEFSYRVSGFNILLALSLLIVWYLLYRRLPAVYGAYMLAVGGTLALLVNSLRIAAAVLIHPQNPGVARFLSEFPALLLALGCFLLTLLLMRGLLAATRHMPAPAQRAATGAGKAIAFAVNPFVALLTYMGRLGALWKMSERGIEKGLSKMFKKKRRNNW